MLFKCDIITHGLVNKADYFVIGLVATNPIKYKYISDI